MSKDSDTYTNFMNALDVINRAIDENRDSIIYGKLFELGDKLLEGKKFGAEVYRDDPESPHDYFTVRWHNNKLELEARGKNSPDLAWKVSEDYLQDVSENPESYIKQPAKLDIQWLLSRAGVNT